MSVSNSQLRATARYHDKNYDTISIRLKKGKREYYKAEAEKRSVSLATLIQVAVEKYINDTPKIYQ